MRNLSLSILLLTFCSLLRAQEEPKFRVHLSDKKGVEFHPHSYFSQKAIERRKLHGIPLDHKSDRPLKKEYVDRVERIAGPILFKSRWFNMLYLRMDAQEKREVRALDCVQRIEQVFGRPKISAHSRQAEDDTGWTDRLLKYQTRTLGVEEFRDHGITGEGVRIAVLDNGFEGVKENPIFDHLLEKGSILGTRDFVQNDGSPYDGGSHGRMVLSCIAGVTQEGEPMGLAPDAEFLLARTERTMWEPFAEEENWLAAAEWADKQGARIINSSLGYTYHRYFPKDMNGTSYVAQAANMAARKGILVVTSAGNSGDGDWKVIGTPADADSALTIGGIDPNKGIHSSFSSFGPTADGELKPNLSAFGTAMVAKGSRGMTTVNGTSLSSPLVAGFAACAFKTDTTMRTMEFFAEMERSGLLYPYYDLAHGYGLPRAGYFTGSLEEADPSFQVKKDPDSLEVKIREGAMPSEGMKNRPAMVEGRGLLYYHLVDEEGDLKEYAVLLVNQRKPFAEPLSDLNGSKLRIHYRGHTKTIDL